MGVTAYAEEVNILTHMLTSFGMMTMSNKNVCLWLGQYILVWVGY